MTGSPHYKAGDCILSLMYMFIHPPNYPPTIFSSSIHHPPTIHSSSIHLSI